MIDRPDTGLKAGYILRMHGKGCILFIQRFRLDLADFAPPCHLHGYRPLQSGADVSGREQSTYVNTVDA